MITYEQGLDDSQLTHITPALRRLAVRVDVIKPDPDNARLHDARNIKAIAQSLKSFGQRKPIVVEAETGCTQAGAGTLEAAKLLGWRYIAAVLVTDDGKTGKAYALADNRTAELASWDFQQVSKQVRELYNVDSAEQPLLAGWDLEEIAPLLRLVFEPREVSDEEFRPDEIKGRPIKDVTGPQRLRFDKIVLAEKIKNPKLTEGDVLMILCDAYEAQRS
jgi:ParB-like chromosome segregation protein Spo0J